MMVNLDLAEPVTYIVDQLKDLWSLIPVAVLGSDTRGGFDPGEGLKHPQIIPVEGPEGEPRKGRTKLGLLPGLTEITVYKVSKTTEPKTQDKKFGNSFTRLTIDVYNAEGRVRMYQCYNEAQRIMYYLQCHIGGNYNRMEIEQDTELTNRTAGLWRTKFDIMLIKVSDYISHIDLA